ncbi:MAG TPA: NADH-quinone oxidoreductase subunit C [Bryobacteraceae bacterium]|nr:NADH-quinone oxidoreductase subunit C [Bryobacteraceae bacterium]
MADEHNPEGSTPPPASGGASEPPKPKEAPKAPAAKPAAPAHAAPKPPAPMAATPWEGELPNQLKEHFGDQITACSSYLGQNFVVAKPDAVIPILEFLKLEADFDYLVDITAVDYPNRAERFELFYILYSFPRNERVRVKTAIADGAQPQTAVPVHTGANWLEREVFDMFGIQFAGHPDMRRILLPEEWQGFPLRKEMSIIQQDDRWVRENLGIESGQ